MVSGSACCDETVGDCGLKPGETAEIVDDDGKSLGSATISADGKTLKTDGNNGVNSATTSINGQAFTVNVQNVADIGSQSQNAAEKTEGSVSRTELIGSIDRSALGINGGNAHDVFDNANEFFKNDPSYRGEKVAFVDKYAISIRNKEDHSEIYAPAVFDSFEAANSYASQPVTDQGGHIRVGYEKVWVNGHHYGGKSTIYRTSTFSRGGYSAVENTIAFLAHESRHFITGSYSRIVPHRTDKEHEAFVHASQSAVNRYRELSRGKQ